MVNQIDLFGFPTVESREAVTEFLETYTGKGTVHSVEVLPPTGLGSRSSAIVQFTNAESAEKIVQLADDPRRLRYGGSFLKARKCELDLASISIPLEHSLENVKLHFGCKISQEQFSVLWATSDVSVYFGVELKDIDLFFSYDCVEYKLQLPSETIRRIELHRPHDQLTKFLLIQLRCAPRIYKNDVTAASDNVWNREVDFTPSCCIAQSSTVCLELPFGCTLPDLLKSFVHYKESEGRFVLEKGNTFSSNSALAPILAPPQGIVLPYKILFKINSLVQHGCIPGQALDFNFYNLVDPTRIRIDYIVSALDILFHTKECCYEPARWLLKQYQNYKSGKRILQSPTISLDEAYMYVHRVLITPSKVYFFGPEVNLSNCILRNYPEETDNFLRVSFVDEDSEKMRSVDLCPRAERRTSVYERILSVLREGIVIGEKKFEFLAFSSSQLRENSVWMFASRSGLTAQDIRKWMGDFSDIKIAAKYAARLGQSFSSSRETFSVGLDEIEFISDVETETDGIQYCFSDGIGKISADFAESVARKCWISSTPSAFQIRYGGYKGVVAVDPTSSKKLSLRNSMCKFKSHNTKLDVLNWSRYHPCFLNRQLITLLSTLGVQDHVFEEKQIQVMNQLKGILTDPLKALEALELMFHGVETKTLKEMLMSGYKPNSEPFLALMLQSFCAAKLVDLRTKTRIFVQNGRSMTGCLDETGTLEYGQVFVQCSYRATFSSNSTPLPSSQDNFIVEDKVVVAKNPCLHPGDVRVLSAVDVPALHHMVDCLVFPKKGNRPHTNECSGSDLDGDEYFVSWDHDLIPPQQTQPMDHSPAAKEEMDHDITMEEVVEFFPMYIVNDNLGMICNAHLVIADKEPHKAMSAACIKLAELHSYAVDFAKTGVPVKVPRRLRVIEFPDFMEKIDSPTYKSKRVIGKLFRQVKEFELGSHSDSFKFKPFTREVARRFYDSDMEVDGFNNYIQDAIQCKSEYDYKLGNLMDYYGIKSEEEILSGNLTNISKFFGKDRESINYAVRSLKKEARTWFFGKLNSYEQADFGTHIDDAYRVKASAWYHVTYHPRYWGRYNKGMARDHFLSFAWCVFDKLLLIKRDKTSIRSSLQKSSVKSHLTSVN